MKKVLSLIVIVAAAAMVSCAGNTNKKAAETTDAAEATEQVATECCGECTQAEGECCKGGGVLQGRFDRMLRGCRLPRGRRRGVLQQVTSALE